MYSHLALEVAVTCNIHVGLNTNNTKPPPSFNVTTQRGSSLKIGQQTTRKTSLPFHPNLLPVLHFVSANGMEFNCPGEIPRVVYSGVELERR
jgi:hypothetical protein